LHLPSHPPLNQADQHQGNEIEKHHGLDAPRFLQEHRGNLQDRFLGTEALLQVGLILVGSQNVDGLQRGVVAQWKESIATLCLADFGFIAYPVQPVADRLLFPVTGIGTSATSG
jgi:hypothetical protein